MKKNILVFVLLCLLYTDKLHSQANASIPQSFNTAVNNSYNGLIPSFPAAGCNDLSWWVSNTGPTGAYVPAIHYNGNTFSAGPWAVSSPWDPSDWITKPNYNCGPNPTAHNCVPGNQDLYYKITFTLATTAFAVNWELYADDKIVDVWVNGFMIWAPNGGGYAHNNMTSFKWCSGWRLGSNDIIVHTLSTNGLTGLKVTSGPSASLTISGNSPVCKNSSTPYTVTANPTITATSYSWTLPSLWGGFSNTSIINAVANGGTGELHAAAYSGTACLGITSKTIVVMPLPTVNIVPSSPSVCPGNTVQLTGNGALSYTWLPAPSLPGGSVANSVTVSPGAGNSYTLIGIAANGCTASITNNIGFLPIPVVFITPQPTFICPNLSNTLTASGAVTYTWNSVPGSPNTNPLVSILNPPQVVTLVGTNSLGCVGNTSISLTAGTLIPVSASNTILCTDVYSCTTISATTSFTGWPPTYNWQPGNLPGQMVSACPSVNTVYTVTANSPVLCPNTTTMAVTLQTCCPPADININFSIPNNPLCNLTLTNLAQYTYSLNAGGPQVPMTGTFSGTGVTFNGNGQYSFNQAQTLQYGNYTIVFTYTTAPYGCSYSLTQTVTVLPPITLYALPAYRCIYSPNGVTISGDLLPNFPPAFWPWNYPVTYTWSPGGMIGQNQIVSPTVTTVYTVTGVSAGCVGSATLQVITINTCCPQSSVTPVLSYTSLAAGNATSSLSGPMIIDQDLTISGPGNFTLQTGDFIINTNVKIILQPGVNLVLSDAHLQSCQYMWQGIEVQNGANVTSSPGPLGLSTLIEDAMSAIDINNVVVGHATPLLNLNSVIFNKNWYSISIRNSTLSTIPVLVKSCVFTSRNLPTGNLSWPNASSNIGGLRHSTTAATSLSPPYLTANNYPLMLSKVNVGLLNGGISVQNIINGNGLTPSTGVDLNSWTSSNPNEFNLFDNLQIAIFASNANLTTRNNAFQNMGLTGIYANTTSTVNTRLSLSSAQINTGNRFWTHNWGAWALWGGGNFSPHCIQATDILEFDIEYATFRGTATSFGPPGSGISLYSNRFNNYFIRNNKFSNLSSGVGFIVSQGGPFNITGTTWNGVYAGSIDIASNFFGPQINSTIPITNEIMGTAVNISAPSTWASGWIIPSAMYGVVTPTAQPGFIQNNTIDRASSGIGVVGMKYYPLGIINNTIDILHQSSYTGGQHGIYLMSSLGNKSIRNNITRDLTGHFIDNIILKDNLGALSITCNTVIGGNNGFIFHGGNACEWTGNIMDNNLMGLHLAGWLIPTASPSFYPAYIGPQGNQNSPSGNEWIGQWGGVGHFETMVDFPTILFQNEIYFDPSIPSSLPLNNSSSNGQGFYSTTFTPLTMIVSLIPAQGTYFCPSAVEFRYSAHNLTDTQELDKNAGNNLNLYPNPTNGMITINGSKERETIEVTVVDLAGKTVYHEILRTEDYKCKISLILEQGIYLVKVKDSNSINTNKKLIINK